MDNVSSPVRGEAAPNSLVQASKMSTNSAMCMRPGTLTRLASQ